MLTSTSASVLPAMARSQLRKSVPTHSRISAVQQLPRVSCRPAFLSEKRHFSRTTSLAYPRKDSQDRESINTEATEYSKSGTDDEAARREDAAFNPDLTDPESQKAKAGESNKVSWFSQFYVNDLAGFSYQVWIRVKTHLLHAAIASCTYSIGITSHRIAVSSR